MSRFLSYLYPRSLSVCVALFVFNLGMLFGSIVGALGTVITSIIIAIFCLFCASYPLFIKIDHETND